LGVFLKPVFWMY